MISKASAFAPALLAAALLLIMPPETTAQDVEARLYANMPRNVNIAAGLYKYSRGDIMVNSAVLSDVKGNIHTVGFAYLRSFSLAGMTAKFDLLIPHVWMDLSGKVTGIDSSRTWNGLGDPRFRLTLNFIGSPALEPAGFGEWKQKTIVGASLQILPPLGKYDSTRLINLGANRWTLKGEIALSQAVRSWVFEGYASFFYFTDNTDFNGGSVLTQETLGIFQAHVIYYFQPRMWLGLDGLYATGGETRVDGLFKRDFQANTRLGATFMLPIAPGHALKLTWSSGVTTRIGGDYDNFALAYFYNW